MTGQGRGPAVVVLALAVGVAALVGASLVTAQSGGGAVLHPAVDDFEDGAETPFPGWSMNDPNNVFSATSNALNGSQSGIYEGDLNTQDQPAEWARPSPTTQNGSLTIAVAGEDGDQANHSIAWYDGSTKLLDIEYRENSSDFNPGEIFVNNSIPQSGQTGFEVDTWEERSTQIQTITVDWDFSSDEADVYLNQSLQGTFQLDNSASDWDTFKINSEIGQPTAADSQVRVDNLGANRTTYEPVIEDQNQQPTGDLQSRSVQIEAPITDADFPATSDSVTVDIYKDGSVVDTQTISSNQTVSTTEDFITGGAHTYHFEAEDSFGNSVTGATETVNVPANLTVRNESDPDEILDSVTADVTFFADGQVITRSTSDGNFTLTGLPTGETILADVEAPGYQDRRILIRSLYQQQSVYMLNNSISTVDVDFQLDDATGKFTAEGTELSVQRPLNQSGTTTYRTVVADELGADKELPTTLEQGQRYRLIVRSTGGETRTLGSYQADGDASPEIIPIGSVSFPTNTEAQTSIGAQLRELSNSRDVQIVYSDQRDATKWLNLTVTNTDTGTEILNTSILNPQQRHIETVPVPAAAPDNVTYNVSYETVRVGENDTSGVLLVGDTPDPATDWPVDSTILTYGGWIFTFALAGWFGLREPRVAPLATVILASALVVIGVYHIPAVLLGLAGVTATTYAVAGGDRS